MDKTGRAKLPKLPPIAPICLLRENNIILKLIKHYVTVKKKIY